MNLITSALCILVLVAFLHLQTEFDELQFQEANV